MSAFLEEAIDFEEFDERIDYGTRFLENVVTMSDFPVEKIEQKVRDMRKIGLGVMGLAQLYIQLGIQYGTEPGNEVARQQLMTHINHASKQTSHELATERGTFNDWEESKYANPTEYRDWFEHYTGLDADEWEDGFPIRNHNTTTIAPTGTTSMIGNTTGGCEPIYNVAYYKNVSDDVQGDEMLVEFDDYFLRTLEENDVDVDAVKQEAQEQMATNEFDGVDGLETVPDAIGELFVVTGDLSGKQHASVQCACQEGVDSAISKTCNFPNDATAEEMEEVYRYIYDHGGKGVTVYRDGTRSKQVLTTRAKNAEFADESEAAEAIVEQIGEVFGGVEAAFLDNEDVQQAIDAEISDLLEATEQPRIDYSERSPRPDSLNGVTQRVETGYGKLYVTINEDENGLPFELFANIGHSGGYTNSSRRRSRKSSRRRSARASIPRRSSTSYRVPGARKSRGTKASRSSRSRTRSAPRFGATSTTMSIRGSPTAESRRRGEHRRVAEPDRRRSTPEPRPTLRSTVRPTLPPQTPPTPRTTRLAPTTRCKNSSRRANRPSVPSAAA